MLDIIVAFLFGLYLFTDVRYGLPKADRSTCVRNRLYQTLRSKYPYMSDEDIDKMVCKTLRIK